MKRYLVVTLGLGLGLVMLLCASVSGGSAWAQGSCDRFVVAVDGVDTGDCSDEENPCETIQYAIDQAADGDLVCVAARGSLPGPTVYYERLTITRTLTLDGKWQATCGLGTCSFEPVSCAPERVVIDAMRDGRVVSISGSIAPTIDCFTLTGGDAAGLGGDPDGHDAGGGIFSQDAAPIIINNVISDNYGCDFCPFAYGRGGGVYLLNAPAAATIRDNLVAYNVADNSSWGKGGGIMLRDSDGRVRDNAVEHNRAGLTAGFGGGIAVRDGMPTIRDNEISWNVAGQSVRGLGGGIYVWSSTPATIEANLVEDNRAITGLGDAGWISRGGGIYYAGNPTVTAEIRDNTVRYNTASPLFPEGRGGGIYLRGLVSPSQVSGNMLEGNLAAHNDVGYGGGIYVDRSEVTLSHNDLFDNAATWAGGLGQGGGVYANGGIVLLHSNVISSNHGASFSGFPSTAIGSGGGVLVSGTLATVRDNLIVGNRSTNGDGAGVGGGFAGIWGVVHIEGNTIADNRATPWNWGNGGGLYLEDTLPTLEANTILDNTAAGGVGGRGGGVSIVYCSGFTLTNNIVARNDASEFGSGVAVAETSTGQLAHNTIAENQTGDGVGVHVGKYSHVGLYGNIVISHTTGIVNADVIASSVVAEYTLFEANGMDYGAGVSSSFEVAGPAALLPDYHLGMFSGAIDQVPALSWITRDIDGDWRPAGAASDVGADERVWRVYLPVVLRSAP
jgi:hypothetical protein